MPLYELFCLAKPGLGKPHLASMISSIGKKVLASGGVLTDVKSHGEQALAYDIRRPGERYSQVRCGSAYQPSFALHSQRIGIELLPYRLSLSASRVRTSSFPGPHLASYLCLHPRGAQGHRPQPPRG